MHTYTQHVIAGARHRSGDVSEIQRYASWTLIQYFALARGWPPRSAAWTDSSAQAWWDEAGPAMLETIQSAWVREGMRAHIRRLAVLNELCWELYPADEDDWQRRDLFVAVAHDVRNLLILPGAVAQDLQAERPAGRGRTIKSAGTPTHGPRLTGQPAESRNLVRPIRPSMPCNVMTP
jgi:hypothetical protein